ncbi:hypothetical protein HCU66_08315 [Pseudomonas frederiksbergensis]|uniref:hypothetical protein n=1 Tax=Pseudomonas frederiksbergensis TaxID=104087 RepID=UPI0019819C6E|nr:hypothetical protein [Pseudomonas frederiksbergensis]MBN3862228.1 hypothetical protein [Pseudomonas frederiksbergensis]
MKSRMIYKIETLVEAGDPLEVKTKDGQSISGKLTGVDNTANAFIVTTTDGRVKSVNVSDIEVLKIDESDHHQPYYYHEVRLVPIAAALTAIVCTAVIGAIGTVVRCAMNEYHLTGGWHPQ